MKCLRLIFIIYVPNISYVFNIGANANFLILIVNSFKVITNIITVVNIVNTKTFNIRTTALMMIMINSAICFGIDITPFFITTIITLSSIYKYLKILCYHDN